MRVGEAELHQPAALIDLRRRHRRAAAEVTQLDDDARISHKLLRHDDRLLGITLRVFKDVFEFAALHAARAVDLFQRQIEALLPLCAIARVLARQRSAYPQIDRISRGGGRYIGGRGCLRLRGLSRTGRLCGACAGSDQRIHDNYQDQ